MLWVCDEQSMAWSLTGQHFSIFFRFLKQYAPSPIPSLLLYVCLLCTCLSNSLGEEQRHVGPIVALADTLMKLSRLKVLDLSHCTLIGFTGHRYHSLNALGNAFAGEKNCLTHLRCLVIFPAPHCSGCAHTYRNRQRF